ncbi:hypothetical protein GWI33_016170 [Rhynchophorus ferrugineus]|uniref:Uncharacterized protein n=1 Tax=Rhynchophorus ferrugineus TaxID=354439 RepID=A0A834M3J6_RHYFE|nr:hypothetical protein GWI33_016170 [Rhynchophorus ferrugineus]
MYPESIISYLGLKKPKVTQLGPSERRKKQRTRTSTDNLRPFFLPALFPVEDFPFFIKICVSTEYTRTHYPWPMKNSHIFTHLSTGEIYSISNINGKLCSAPLGPVSISFFRDISLLSRPTHGADTQLTCLCFQYLYLCPTNAVRRIEEGGNDKRTSRYGN